MKKQRYIPLSFVAATLLLLGACSVGKNYKRPELNAPKAYRGAEATTDSASVADLAWNDFFTDADLKSLINRALAKNYDMRLAVQNMEAAKQQLKQSRAAFAPNIGANLGVSINRPSGSSLNGISLNQFLGRSYLEDYNLGVSLSWEVDIWGKIRRQKEAAKADYMRSEEASRAIQTQLIADVSAGYYTLLMLDAQLNAAQRNLSLTDSVLQITKLRKDVGDGNALAVQLVESQYQAAVILVPQLEQQITLQENYLQFISGGYPDAIQRQNKLENINITDNLAAGFPLSILGRRPDVKASELQLRADNARVGMAQAAMYPSLVINLSAGLNSFTAGNWFNIPGALFGTFFGGITQPLFNRRQLKTQFELAKVQRERSIIEFERSVLNGVMEVSNALTKVEKLKEQQTAANQRVQTLQGAVTSARLLYESGLADYLEVITAQSNLLQGELQAASITSGLYMAKVDLYRALGGGWK